MRDDTGDFCAMNQALEGHLNWLIGGNLVYYHISQVAVHERLNIPNFMFIVMAEIDVSMDLRDRYQSLRLSRSVGGKLVQRVVHSN